MIQVERYNIQGIPLDLNHLLDDEGDEALSFVA